MGTHVRRETCSIGDCENPGHYRLVLRAQGENIGAATKYALCKQHGDELYA